MFSNIKPFIGYTIIVARLLTRRVFKTKFSNKFSNKFCYRTLKIEGSDSHGQQLFK
ncbi:hypothetical protein M918_12735 [Clostridium sp. BL8]|nr:hypothetical protein M918_12735 [Clostridium sp. BL8]